MVIKEWIHPFIYLSFELTIVSMATFVFVFGQRGRLLCTAAEYTVISGDGYHANTLSAQMAHKVNLPPEPLWHPSIAFHATARRSISQSRHRGELGAAKGTCWTRDGFAQTFNKVVNTKDRLVLVDFYAECVILP